MTGQFLTKLKIDRIKRKKEILVELEQDLVYKDSRGDKYTINEGFLSDGASIPKFAWSIVGHPFGEYLMSAIVHDFLYKTMWGKMKRSKMDWVLLDAMKTQKVSFWKRHIMHKSVRVFGGLHRLFTKNEK